MSEPVYCTGKLIKIPMKESLENMCKQILQEAGKEKSDFYDTWLEEFEDELYEKYIILNGDIFKIEMTNSDPYGDIFRASKDNRGHINFEVKYYNGSCSFQEAIERAMKGIG